MDSSSLLGVSELGKLVLSSGLLQSSWSKISNINALTYSYQDSDLGINQKKENDSALGIKIFTEAKCIFVVLAAPLVYGTSSPSSAYTLDGPQESSSSGFSSSSSSSSPHSCASTIVDWPQNSSSASTRIDGSEDQNPFHFLCSEKISSFSVYTPAFQLFSSAYNDLSKLKDELLQSKKPVIITGAALGGAVASLFTLWILHTIDPKLNRPLCITFGSPLIGDAFLQQILENSVRESCFLHVADAARTPIIWGFKPFGAFLICFNSGCICIEDPDTVMELFIGSSTDLVDYGEVLHRLDIQVLSMVDQILIPDDVLARMEERAWKKLMKDIEWYQKRCKEMKISYYDDYRYNFQTSVHQKVEDSKSQINDYWRSRVEGVENKAESGILIHNEQFLVSGNYYRQMIEPLDIAEYYRNGEKDYLTSGRSSHYIKLEKWSENASIKPCRYVGRDLSEILTCDSCFWAETEEAMTVINLIKTQDGMTNNERELSIRKLVRFEEYVWPMIIKHEVSPEIFWEESSFMKWWEDYKEIKGRDKFSSSSPHFNKFMNSWSYKIYGGQGLSHEDFTRAARGKRCQRKSCSKHAEGLSGFCISHGGGRQCEFLGCTKSGEGRSYFCIAHGGGERCSHEDCTRAAKGRSGLCISHGGGKRCQRYGCSKSAEGIWEFCISHGGGRRCQSNGCSKGAQGRTVFCKAHSGGKRCTCLGYKKGVEGSTPFCNVHGGLSLLNVDDHISHSATRPGPGPSDRPKSSVDEEEVLKVVYFKLHLPNDKEKNKALSTITKISGVFSVALDGYERIRVTGHGTMDPVVVLKEVNKFWSAEIINVASGDSGSGSIIGNNTDILIFSCNDNDADETLFIEAILKGLHKREVTPLKYNLSGRACLDMKMLFNSSVGIMVLSDSFSHSGQFLEHLVAIMEHWKANHFVIIPVYFKVSPLEMCRLEDRFEAVQLQYLNSIQKWKEAMTELASINGHQWAEGTQFILAEEVGRDAWLYLRNRKNVVRILALLKHSQIVGIWGMAGIGKTFIASETFEILAPQYDLCYFGVMDQREGLRQMRDDFFSNVFRGEKLSIGASDVKPSFMRDLFLNKKILIVLDDVSNARDVAYVIGGFDWFSRGHRIILTSRRKQVLIQCKIKEPYEIKMCEFESLRLCKEFLKGEQSGIIPELMSCSSGIPLALKVLGSSVSKQPTRNMKEHLQSLRINPPDEIQEAFQRSFDGLDENEKNIFLDLACFFRGGNKDHVVQLLDACGFFTSLGISDLIDESLISLQDEKIEIPTPFQDMGRFIVRKEDVDPWARSRLWDSKDIIGVLEKHSGTEAIEGIFLDMSDVTCELSPTVFCEMDRLRLLKFYCSTSGKECKLNLSSQGLDSLPDELRLLHWEHYPLKYLPQKFDPENLVEINMPCSNLEKLWEGKKNLAKLKVIKLSHSSKLTDILMLSEALNLEHIDLEGCTSLVDLSTSIPLCGKLVSLNMKDCPHIRCLPSMVDLTHLKLLNLSGCSELEEIQNFAPNLEKLYLAETAIKDLPLSVENLTKLETLDLENCRRLQKLPFGIENSRYFLELKLSGCTSLESRKRKR